MLGNKDVIRSMNLANIKELAKRIETEKISSGNILIKNRSVAGPLSSAQERMIFLNQFCPFYHSQSAIYIDSQFDFNISLIEASFNKMIERYEILRTVFDLDNHQQIVLPKQEISLKYINLQNDSDVYEKTKEIIAKENSMPFDLEKGPLLKLIIIQLAKRQYVFATIAHHIITDGWSNSMMFHELVSIAKVLSEEDALSLPDPEFQYLDYVAWEKKFLLNEANYINVLNY